MHGFGHAWTGPAYWLFIAGLAAMFIAVVGLWLASLGGSRRRVVKRERVVAEPNVADDGRGHRRGYRTVEQ
jgi:hypothetical protein